MNHRLGVAALAVVAALIATAAPVRAASLAPERLLVTLRDPAALDALVARFGGQAVGPNGWAVTADPAVVDGLAGVADVGPDTPVRAQVVPNDPCITSCSNGQSQWYLAPVGASSAWDRSKGDGVTIAILDSGVDFSHPDLAPKSAGSVDFTDVHDGNGEHGTKVAGIAGGATNNGIGIASVGWNVNLLSIKVLDINGEGFTSWVINGI